VLPSAAAYTNTANKTHLDGNKRPNTGYNIEIYKSKVFCMQTERLTVEQSSFYVQQVPQNIGGKRCYSAVTGSTQ